MLLKKNKENSPPVIGVTASVRGSAMSWLFNRLAVWRAGGRPVRLTSKSKTSTKELDGLIIGGGDDIGAELYDGELQFNVRFDEQRDRLEQTLLLEGLNEGIPILGICRGAQMINIHLGGNLHADIYEIYKEVPRMRTILQRKRITIKPGSLLYKIMRHRRYRINCLHHQSINELGKGLDVSAKDDYGIIQAIEHPGHPFLLGVQWHPEYLPHSSNHQSLFRALVKEARAA